MTEQVCPLTHRRDPDRPRRAGAGIVVCLGHERRVIDALVDLPHFHEELLLRHLGGPNVGAPKVSGSSEDPMPYRPEVGDEREMICGQLAAWANWLRSERKATVATFTSIRANALALSYHLDFILASEMAEDFCTEILERHAKAFSILYPTGRRKFPVGGCTEKDCPGTVNAILRDTDQLLPSSLKCDTCGLDLPASAWLRYGREIEKRTQEAGTL